MLAIRIRVLGEWLRRHAHVLAFAWRERKSFEGPAFSRLEAEFLPAALALQSRPVSPAPRVAMWLIICFAWIAILWACFGKLDIVATAAGKVIPSEGSKLIQSVDRAAVKAIHVRDGQEVKAGDVLIELDGVVTQADRERISGDLAVIRLQVARSRELLAALDSGKLPAGQRPAGVSDLQWLDNMRLREGLYAEYISKLRRVEDDAAQREAELRSAKEAVSKLEQTVPIAQRRAEDYRDLVGKNFVSRHGYLEREQSRIELESDLAMQRSKVIELEVAVRATRSQKIAAISEMRRIHLDSSTEGLQKIASLEQELIKAESRDSQTRLLAPVDGTVQQLAVHTVGGVVTEAQPLMIVVPKGKLLEIEVFTENKDIGFVSAGQDAEVKIETFPYTKYGTVLAKVISVSSDAISDEKRGLIYSTRARMARATINVDGKEVGITPGMAVTMEIKIGKRRVVEYFLSPLMQYKHEGLRER